jgi:hypothetical protein
MVHSEIILGPDFPTVTWTYKPHYRTCTGLVFGRGFAKEVDKNPCLSENLVTWENRELAMLAVKPDNEKAERSG